MSQVPHNPKEQVITENNTNAIRALSADELDLVSGGAEAHIGPVSIYTLRPRFQHPGRRRRRLGRSGKCGLEGRKQRRSYLIARERRRDTTRFTKKPPVHPAGCSYRTVAKGARAESLERQLGERPAEFVNGVRFPDNMEIGLAAGESLAVAGG